MAEILGVQADYLSRQLRRKKGLSSDMARIYEEKLNLQKYALDEDAEFFSAKLILPPDEIRLLNDFRKCDVLGKNTALGIVKSLSETHSLSLVQETTSQADALEKFAPKN